MEFLGIGWQEYIVSALNCPRARPGRYDAGGLGVRHLGRAAGCRRTPPNIALAAPTAQAYRIGTRGSRRL